MNRNLDRDLSITALISAMTANTWLTADSAERRAHRQLCLLAGGEPPQPEHVARIPAELLAARDMTVQGVSGSNYISGTAAGQFLPSIKQDSVALKAGAQVVPVTQAANAIATPKGTSGATGYWLADENTQITESQPTLASVGAAAKVLAARATFSRQLLLQGANTEQVVRDELRSAVARALDAAIFAGTGASGQPTGITSTSGVGNFSGTSLGLAALRNAQSDVAASVIDSGAVALVTTASVAETLAARQRFSGSSTALWEGSSLAGRVEGVAAYASVQMPAATAILGDWSHLWILEWLGGLMIDVDPYTEFNTGLISVRILLDCDVMLPRPEAFTVASSIT